MKLRKGQWAPPLKRVPFCLCGCGEKVRVIGRRTMMYRQGHARRVLHAWEKEGYSKELARGFMHIFKKYRLTKDVYFALLKKQGGRCAICRTKNPGSPTGRKGTNSKRRFWCVDHHHGSKRVRGLLCSSCNIGLGLFKDRASFLEAAARYLRRRPWLGA